MRCITCNRKLRVDDGGYICRKCRRLQKLNADYLNAIYADNKELARHIMTEIIALADPKVIKIGGDADDN